MSQLGSIENLRAQLVKAGYSKEKIEQVLTKHSAEIQAHQYYETGWNIQTKECDDQGAIAAYSKALAIYPQFADAYFNRGISYQNLQQYEAAIADYDKAIEYNPQISTDVYIHRGRSYEELGRSTDAIADFSKALEAHPPDQRAYFYRGYSYCRIYLFDLAVKDFDSAIKINPLPIYFHIRGCALVDLNRTEEAIASFNRYIDLETVPEKITDAREIISQLKQQ